jgi:hypothetical protein
MNVCTTPIYCVGDVKAALQGIHTSLTKEEIKSASQHVLEALFLMRHCCTMDCSVGQVFMCYLIFGIMLWTVRPRPQILFNMEKGTVSTQHCKMYDT